MIAVGSGDRDYLIKELYDIRKHKAALEQEEKQVLSLLKPLVDPDFDLHADSSMLNKPDRFRIFSGNLELSRAMGTSRTIQRERLLERGVAPDVIADATKTSVYFQYRVRAEAQGDGDAE